MKKTAALIVLLALLSAPAALVAGESEALLPDDHHAVSFDLYFYNGSYFFFTLDMGYRSPSLLENADLRATAAFKSYGLSAFVLKPGIQELESAMELSAPSWRSGSVSLGVYGLAGGVLWFSTRTHKASVQPLLGGGLTLAWRGLAFRLPARFRLYENGFSFSAIPRIGWRAGPVSIHALYESEVLTTWDFTNHDFRGRFGLGTEILFAE